MSAAGLPLRDVVLAGQYELAALRLLHGLLVTLEAAAPEAREALLDELAARRPGDAAR